MNKTETIIDVREQDEFKAERIENSINVPLSQFGTIAPGILSNLNDRQIILMCRSGKRAELAYHEARRLGFAPDGGYRIYEGGLLGWKKSGGRTVCVGTGHLPLLRQTHLAAGLMALTGVVLGFSVHPGFFALPGVVGIGLTVSGLTGLCLMTELLAKMPWNGTVEHVRS